MTPAQKAAATRKRRAAAAKAARTRKQRAAGAKAAKTRKRRAAGRKAAETRKKAATADLVQVERVARSADELALLCGVVDHLPDDAPRLVYADWLEERDDPRGPVLRKFVLACRAGKKLPSLDGVPPAWADLTGLTITQKVVACGLRDRRNELLAL